MHTRLDFAMETARLPRPRWPERASALATEHCRDSRFPTLFSPIGLGALMSKNRVMRVATTSNLAERIG